VKKILKYNRFLKEATLSGDKRMPYSLSRTGKSQAMKKLVSEIETSNINNFDIKLDIINDISDFPSADDKVIWIRNSTVEEIGFSDLKSKLGVTSNDDLMIYHTDSDDITVNWAVAKRGSKTTMVRQYNRVGPSKRGNHFRETAFLITLSMRAWLNAGVKIDVHTNHGKILMRYESTKEGRFVNISNHESMAKVNASYESYKKDSSKEIIEGMENQCDFLLGYNRDGNRIKNGYLSESDLGNISYIVKNYKDLLINKFAHRIFKEEIENKKSIIQEAGERLSDYNFYDIPELANMSKWNPSDFWIVFKGDESLSNEKSYLSKQIEDIDDINDFLSDSVINRKGLVGVSLKQTTNDPKLMIVNSGNKDIENKLETGDLNKVIKDTRKTANIDFSWRFGDNDNWKIGSGIDCRTFDSNKTSNISLELKSKGGYVSGKAGSMINHLMPDDLYEIKEFIRKEKDKSEIRRYLDSKGFVVENEYLDGIFNQDLSGDGEKTNAENSRLQSIVFIDWLYNLPQERRDDYITQIVDFAKSESIWSAPHLVVK